MPIYEYGCSKCELVFERLLKMSEADIPLAEPCPECGSEGTVGQLMSTFALGDPIRMGVKRPDGGWGDVLKKVKSAHPKGNWGNQKFSPLSGG
jgi:putative FmdB family regulatory protein